MANATPEALRSRMDKVQAELSAERRALNRGATFTILAGVIILGLLSFYFYYGFTQIIGRLQPKELVDAAETYVLENVPTVRKTAEEEIKKGAPVWAEFASKQVRDSVPEMSAAVQTVALTMADDVLKQGTVHSKEVLSTYITKNKSMLAEGIKKLSGSDKEAESFVRDVTETSAKEMEADLQGGFKQILDNMDSLIATVVKCKSDRGLTRTQEEVREVFRLMKRLFTETAPAPEEPKPAPKPTTAPNPKGK